MSDARIRILVIEDNPGDVRLLREALAGAGVARFSLETVDRLSTGLEHLAVGGVDAAILDLGLPDSQGLDTLTRFRTQAPGVPIVVLSGLDDEALAIQAVAEGAQDYLVKGQVDDNLLVRSVRYAIERKRAEETLRQRNRELALLNRTTRALTSTLDLDQVLVAALGEVERLLGVAACSIWLTDPETGELVCRQTVGLQSEVVSGWRLAPGEGIAGRVACNGESLIVPDAWEDERYFEGVEHRIGLGLRSILSVPLRVQEETIGVLQVVDTEADRFHSSDLALLEPLAAASSIAIENARLHRQVLDHAEQLEQLVRERTAEILAEKERSETILRSVGDAIALADLEMRIQYINDAFTTLTGYTAEEVLGQPTHFLATESLSEPDRQAYQRATAEGEVWQGEVTARRKDGRTYDAALTIGPVRDAEGQLVGYVFSHRDISHIRELDRARSRFVTNVSHQLRTPVTALRTSTYLLRKGGNQERAEHLLGVIENETARLTHLIQDILEVAELDSGQTVIEWEPVSIPTVVEHVLTHYQSQAEASGLTLVATPLLPDLPAVKGDEARLTRALGEIVENGITFTPAGGQVTIEAGILEREGQRWVTVTVRDTGPGIPTEEQERVFDRFYRGSLAESGHVPGTGLGLSIAQEIVHAHGGRIWVESEPGRGSAFRITLLMGGEKL